MSTIALHIIAKDEYKELKRIILDYHKYVDQIDIAVDDDHTIELLKLMLEKLNGDIHVNVYKYEWSDKEKERGFPNFDDKRNFLVDKCTCHFYLRLDTDDEIVSPEIIREIVAQADEKRIDIVSCYYDYSRDEWGNTHAAHYRETIIRNNKMYTWNKHIHENILPKYQGRRVPIVMDKRLKIRHNIDFKHALISRDRNLKFLMEEYEETKDNPDPRTLAYLGRMLYPMGKYKEAKYFLEQHIAKSGWDEDRCMSWCYLANVMEKLGDLDQALACCYEGINERPDFPDPYIAMHTIYFTKGDWAKALHWGEVGLRTKRPDSFMLIDPASYTWRPAITMAHSELMLGNAEKAKQYFDVVKKYAPGIDWVKNNEKIFEGAVIHKQYVEKFAWMLQLLKEKDQTKIPKMFDIIPKELQKHELLIRMRHQHTPPRVWGDNEIAIFCGQSWEDWAAPSVLKGIGGSEEAVIYISKELTKLGHKVTVFTTCGEMEGEYEGVVYKDYNEFNPFDSYNTLILWRGNVYRTVKAKRKIVWLHDVPINMFKDESELSTVDKIMVLSEYHKTLLPKHIPDEKIYVSSNGINLKDFRRKDIPERNPHRMIYTSSYDRGIQHLLEMWSDIKTEVPDAELHLFYGWDVYDAMIKHKRRDPKFKIQMQALMNQPGVFEHGRVSHKKLVKEFYRSKFYVYPCHFEEISCISAMKAQVCGCVPVVVNYAALKETVKEGVKVEGKAGVDDTNERYKQVLIKALKEQPTINVEAEQFGWDKVARRWHEDLLTKDIRHAEFKNLEDYKAEYSKTEEFIPPNFSQENGKPILLDRFQGTLAFCKEVKAKSLIDIGCSDGALCFICEDNGIESDGIEICPKCIDFAKDYAQKNNYKCTFHHGILEEVDIDKKYDVASVQEVMEHVLDPKSFLEKVNKLAKYVYITTPHKNGIFGESNRDRHHLRSYDEESIRELIGDKKIIALDLIHQGGILVAAYEN